MVVLQQARGPSEVLLIHAPYPGRLKFQGVPSSMFSAIGPFVAANGAAGVAYLDPRGPTAAFYQQVAGLLESGRIRALCISTSTAAIGEAIRLAGMAAELAPETLVVVGGPHEDAMAQKVAERVPGVHVSISGDAAEALQVLLEDYLESGQCAEAFVAELSPFAFATERTSGSFTIACCRWDRPCAFDRGPSRVADSRPLVFPESYPKFDVFQAASTIPLMVTRGCPYGKCTFCAEANRDGSVTRTADCRWVRELAERNPGAAIYFQDSIFPATEGEAGELLPMLKSLDREWGCQVFLPMLTERRVAELAAHGCSYLYTGVESGSSQVVTGVNKPRGTRDLVLERIGWMRDHGVRVGISLMFGAMAVDGQQLDSEAALQQTESLIEGVLSSGVKVAGVYPNVQTVLPGTALARGLAQAGHRLDYYSMPRTPIFDSLEDGGVGYNFLSINKPARAERQLAESIVQTADRLQRAAGGAW